MSSLVFWKKVEKILYSNRDYKTETGRVEEVQNIYDLFQLMAGIEEFVNFSSVNALERYYEGKRANLSEPLNQLLVAMKNFADAIKLCHYGQFNAAIKNLHDAVKDFEPTDDVEDVLMSTFIALVRKDYADLIFPREKDDLRVICRCLDNDYLQQALILYTERIPEYLGKHGNIVTAYKILNAASCEIKRPLDQFDRAVLSVCTSEFLADNCCTTIPIIYRALTGKIDKGDAKPTKEQRATILDSIQIFMSRTFISEPYAARSSLKYNDGSTTTIHSALLPA